MDVGAWLRSLGLERYEGAFRDNAIDAEVLPELSEADLEKLGVLLGHRKRLLRAIAGLREPPAEREAATPVAPAHQPTAERRQLTVMFADLVGSTALSGQLDPEEMSGIIRVYQNAVAGEVTRFGGHVAKYLGDGVLAYFGYPKAHEDAAERAVRAGLAIVEAVGGLSVPEGGTPLVARVGIATGLVVVGELIGEGEAREEAVVGETPNLAARLQTLAAPSSVVIGAGTRRLVGDLFELEDLGARMLKGFAAPVPAWRVLRPSRVEGRFEARQGAGLTPLVGRGEELALLRDCWEKTKDGEGQVVLLTGEPGIGKSRLVRALRERLAGEPHTPLRYQCSPHHTGSALYPVIDQLERAAGFERDDPPERKLAKLEALLAEGTADVGAVAPLVADLLSVPTGGRYPPLGLTPQRRKAETLKALVAQLVGLAARQPVLVVLEDAHWLDPTTQELFDLVVERVRDLPVLALITFRPEFQPPWTGHPHVTALTLNRLSRRQGAALVERVADKALPDEMVEQIAAKTDGVPLFVEELTKAVLESGLLQNEGGRYTAAGPLPPLAIPTTLQDSLLARLDRLAPVKEVAQIGAAIGREFSYELLATVAPMDEASLREVLNRLVASGLVFRRGTPPEASYVFKHALVQDVAYQTLLKSRRQQLHAHIAQRLEDGFPSTARSEPETLAHHLTCAGLYERATDYWLRAGSRNAARSAYLEATSNFVNGLHTASQIADQLRRQEKELEIRSHLASALRVTKGHVAKDLEDMLRQMLNLARNLEKTAEISYALNGLSLVHLNRGELSQAHAYAREALARATEAHERACELLARRTLGTTLFLLGQFSPARVELQRCIDIYSPEDDCNLIQYYSFDPFVAGLGFLSWSCWVLGYPDAARRHLREAHTHASTLQHGYSLVFIHVIAALLCLMLREPSASRTHADAAIKLSAEQRLPYFSSIAKGCEGWAQARAGQVVRGLNRIREGLEAHQAVPWEPFMHSAMAESLADAGRGDEALSCLAAADLVAERTGACWWTAEIHRLRGLPFLVLPAPKPVEAASSFGAAIDLARSQQAMSWELRASMSLARLWADQGERRKAHDLLAPVYGWFTEGFDTPDLKDAKALLDELR